MNLVYSDILHNKSKSSHSRTLATQELLQSLVKRLAFWNIISGFQELLSFIYGLIKTQTVSVIFSILEINYNLSVFTREHLRILAWDNRLLPRH